MLEGILPKNQHLKISIIALSSIRCWPLDLKNKPKLQKCYKLYSHIMLFYFVSFVIRQFIEMFRLIPLGNLDNVMKNVALTLLTAISLVRVLVCKTESVLTIFKDIERTEEKILGCDEAEVKKIYLEFAKYSQFVNKFFLTVGLVTSVPFYFLPFAEEHSQKQRIISENSTEKYIRTLPLSVWTPYDYTSHYGWTYIWQILDGCVSENFVVYTDALLYSLIIFPVGQMKILQYILKNFAYYVDKEAKLCRIQRDEAGFAVARACIILHKDIINYVERFNEAIRNVMLLDFISCSLQMSVLLLRVIMSDHVNSSMISDCEFLMSMVVQMFLFYWHANELIVESTAISNAAAHNTWYNEPGKVKKILLLLAVRAQKPLTVSIGPFYPMSTETSISILKATYSYGMLLRESYLRKVA